MELAPAVGKSGLFRSKRSPRKRIDVIDFTGFSHVCLGAGKGAPRCSNVLSGETEQRDICRRPSIGKGQGIPIATIS
jgi:hypothetical protein